MSTSLIWRQWLRFSLLLRDGDADLQRFPFLVGRALPVEQRSSLGRCEPAAGQLPAMQVPLQLFLRGCNRGTSNCFTPFSSLRTHQVMSGPANTPRSTATRRTAANPSMTSAPLIRDGRARFERFAKPGTTMRSDSGSRAPGASPPPAITRSRYPPVVSGDVDHRSSQPRWPSFPGSRFRNPGLRGGLRPTVPQAIRARPGVASPASPAWRPPPECMPLGVVDQLTWEWLPNAEVAVCDVGPISELARRTGRAVGHNPGRLPLVRIEPNLSNPPTSIMRTAAALLAVQHPHLPHASHLMRLRFRQQAGRSWPPPPTTGAPPRCTAS